MNIKKIAKDVRGAALVYVIVAAAIIVLLGAATTATAYVNLRATQVQEQSDNNFYSTDMIMNAIVSGLEQDISDAYNVAYTEVITKINGYESTVDAEAVFKEIFINELNCLLNDKQEGASDENFSFEFAYKPDRIQGYVAAVFADDVKYTVTALNGKNFLDLTDEGMILRNLHITYESDSGYFDEITTDVKISIPQFIDTIPPENISLNAVVIDDGLNINTQCGLTITGDTYIDEDDQHSAIYLNNTSSLSILSPTELIAGGKIFVNDFSSLTLRGVDEKYGNEIWTENIKIGRSTSAIIKGQTFVYDDLEVNGSDSSVKLSGEYYGYSNNNQQTNQSEGEGQVVNNTALASESSSININGARTSIDIRELDMLVLAGTSYLNVSDIKHDDLPGNKNDLQLGESFSVKSNQIAYMVDDKICVENGIKYLPANPMSYAQYLEVCPTDADWAELETKILTEPHLDFTLKDANGNPIYVTYSDYNAKINRTFSSAQTGGTVYLYLSFDNPEDAARYFNDAYSGNSLLSLRLRTYAAQYLSNLQLGENTKMLAGHNYIDTTDSFLPAIFHYTASQLENQNPGEGQWFDYEQAISEVQNSVNSISASIFDRYIGDGKIDSENCGTKYKVHYSKLIDEARLREMINMVTTLGAAPDAHTNSTVQLIQNGFILKGTSEAVAIIVDNAESGVPFVLDSSLGYEQGLIVVTGDLEIRSNWLGSVIVGGKATCTGGGTATPVNITTDALTVESVTSLYVSTTVNNIKNSMMILNIFQGYTNAPVNNATNNSGINADMISTCITFTNWNRD